MGSAKKKYRAIFLSDIHMGTKGCQAESLIEFLKSVECEKLYLVGDIIDGWRMKRGIYWPSTHNEIIRLILKKAKEGTHVYYIAGNHDEFLRPWMRYGRFMSDSFKVSRPKFGNISISNKQIFDGIDGKRYLVIHGDLFDNLMRKNLKWIMHLGDFSYNALIWLNTRLNVMREWFGLPYWSLSKFLKDRTKRALKFIHDYEENMVDYAKAKGYNGVICGHIHKPDMKTDSDGFVYINTGDWVENCTAVVESENGIDLIHYHKNRSK